MVTYGLKGSGRKKHKKNTAKGWVGDDPSLSKTEGAWPLRLNREQTIELMEGRGVNVEDNGRSKGESSDRGFDGTKARLKKTNNRAVDGSG